MNRKKINSKIEEKIITAMITSKEFLVQTSPSLDIDLFSADHFKIIAKWCKSFFNKYHKAPEHHIETKYHSWVDKGKAKEETVEAVGEILEKLSDNYEEEKRNNIPYLLDEAAKHLQLRKITQLRDKLDFSLLENDINIAEKALDLHSNVKIGMNRGIDVFRDENAWQNAYSQMQKPLFNMGSNNLNFFFAHALSRDNLIGILGREKIGKTFWCTEFAIRALMNRRKTALFEVGDLSESQIMKRIGMRFSNRPLYKQHCGKILIPVKMMKRKNKRIKVKYKKHICKKIASRKSTMVAIKKFMRRFGISPEESFYKISIHPNYSVNVAEINNVLDRWEDEDGFIPEVIIIDYGDILADEPGTGNYSLRDKENIKWMALRRLSQERHSLTIVPTQSDAKSYDAETLGPKNFSEDKRKLAHVTGMLGLNQNAEEKEKSIMRLNWVGLREAPFSIDKCLYVGQCLKLGRAFCCGYY